MNINFKSGAVQAIGIGLIIKTITVASMLYFFYAFSDFESVAHLWNRLHTHDNLTAWFIPFANWDGQHYLRLVDQGYASEQSAASWHFYPLYPWLLQLLSLAFPPEISAMLLSYACTIGFCFYIYRLAVHFNSERPYLPVLLVMAFPTAFFTAAFYTEALFLFLMMGFIYHHLVTKSNIRLAFLLLLPLTRGTAAFVFGGMALFALLEYANWRRTAREARSRETKRTKVLRGRRARRATRYKSGGPTDETEASALPAFDWRFHAYGFIAFLAGSGLYLGAMDLMTGSPFSGIAAQRDVVSEHSVFNLLNPLIFLRNLFYDSEYLANFTPAGHRMFIIAMVLAVAVFVKYREWGLLCFYFPMAYAHAAMSEGALSYERYALMAIPFLAFSLAKNIKWRLPLYTLCTAGFAYQAYLAYRFSLNEWVA